MVIVGPRLNPTNAMVIVGRRFEHRRTTGVDGCYRKMAAPAPNRKHHAGVDFYPWKDFIRAVVLGPTCLRPKTAIYRPWFSASFNEHIFARKFFAPLPMPSLADKLAVKDYVRARFGDEVLPAVAWVGDDVGGLFAAKLPAGRYVLKANHGWQWNLFLNLPDDLSAKRAEIEQRATIWVTSRFGYDWGEWQYCTFKPKLFLEEFIDFNGVRTPDDYKFYCFHGKARLIEVDVDRFTQMRTAFYTPDWKYIPVAFMGDADPCARPHNLEEMIRVAEAIAGEMEFARVDLYSDGNSRIRFGEITFTPANAAGFSDIKLDQWLGAQFGKGGRSIASERRLQSPIRATETRLSGMRRQD